MPGMDGLDLARRMREQQDLAKTPAALMVTAFGRDEVQLQAAQLGPRGLLIKPLTASALRSCIREALRDPESPRRKARRPALATAALPGPAWAQGAGGG